MLPIIIVAPIVITILLLRNKAQTGEEEFSQKYDSLY